MNHRGVRNTMLQDYLVGHIFLCGVCSQPEGEIFMVGCFLYFVYCSRKDVHIGIGVWKRLDSRSVDP